MSQMLENMFNAMAIKKVPANWESIAYPSQKPLGSWFADLVERMEFMKRWVDTDYLPSYWCSAFFFPQGFMTAALQSYARQTKIPIDKLVFETRMLGEMGADITEGPDIGISIFSKKQVFIYMVTFQKVVSGTLSKIIYVNLIEMYCSSVFQQYGNNIFYNIIGFVQL